MSPKTVDREEHKRRVDESKRIAAAEQEKLKQAANAVFKSDAGLKLGKWLVNQCGFLESDLSVGPAGTDALASAYSTGRRSVLVDIFGILRVEVKRKLLV